jgi:hypothetical protein
LGALLAVAGLGYVIDTVAAVLVRGAWIDVSTFTFVGEFLLALWLLIQSAGAARSTHLVSADDDEDTQRGVAE